jgi:hypothetical protein
MLITMPDMMGMPAIWAQQSTLPSGGSMQQETIPYKQQQQQQDVSKLTKWLGLDFEDEAPPEHQTYERTGFLFSIKSKQIKKYVFGRQFSSIRK